MSCYFCITQGPLKGAKVRLRDGLTFGREKADINLQDPTVSSIHGKISIDAQGQWKIVDMNSQGGIYYNDEKVQHFVLTEGISIRMGKGLFTFQKRERTQKTSPPQKNLRTIKKSLGEWRLDVLNLCQEVAPQIKDHPIVMAPFRPPLSLKILQGMQAHTQLYMGYGPREIGSNTLDFRLFEAEIPDCAFELHPMTYGVIIKAPHPEVVRLNGRLISSREVKDGDIVSIHGTHIQISFLA